MKNTAKVLLTVGPRGQITIPANIRKKWKSRILALELSNGDQVTLSPIQEVAGSLSDFKIDTNLSFNEIRRQSWQNSVKISSDKQ